MKMRGGGGGGRPLWKIALPPDGDEEEEDILPHLHLAPNSPPARPKEDHQRCSSLRPSAPNYPFFSRPPFCPFISSNQRR